MVDIVNGKNEGPLAGWVIAQSNGLTLIGCPDPGRYLSPVFHMQPNLVQGQGGGAAPIHPCFPVFLLAIDHLELPPGALIVPVETLSKPERAQLARFVEQADQMLQQMKAAASGIALAKQIPKLPPGLVRG